MSNFTFVLEKEKPSIFEVNDSSSIIEGFYNPRKEMKVPIKSSECQKIVCKNNFCACMPNNVKEETCILKNIGKMRILECDRYLKVNKTSSSECQKIVCKDNFCACMSNDVNEQTCTLKMIGHNRQRFLECDISTAKGLALPKKFVYCRKNSNTPNKICINNQCACMPNDIQENTCNLSLSYSLSYIKCNKN